MEPMNLKGAAWTLHAASLEGLFHAAALRASARLVDPSTVHPGGLRDRLEVEAPSLEELMGLWLNAVLRQYWVNGTVLAGVEKLRLERAPEKCRLSAEIAGELLDPGRHGVLPGAKAARASSLQESDGGWQVDVSFDV